MLFADTRQKSMSYKQKKAMSSCECVRERCIITPAVRTNAVRARLSFIIDDENNNNIAAQAPDNNSRLAKSSPHSAPSTLTRGTNGVGCVSTQLTCM
jgi:hypothetical protein